MLEHAPEETDRRERRLKAAAIVAALEPEPRLREPREPRPPRAGRVRHHRPRPRIQASVPSLIPEVDAGQPRIGAVRVDEEGGVSRGRPRKRPACRRSKDFRAQVC